MTKDELAGFVLTLDTAEQYYLRVIEAEKTLGTLTREERIVILKSLGSPLTLEELLNTIADKRVLIVKEENK